MSGAPSTESAICKICGIRHHLQPATGRLIAHGPKAARCLGSNTRRLHSIQHIDLIEQRRGWRRISQQELSDHTPRYASVEPADPFGSFSAWRQWWSTARTIPK